MNPISHLLIFLIRVYQLTFSPLLPLLFGVTGCRHHPSCSQYFILSLHQYGLLQGTSRGFRRLLTCHPFSNS